MKNITYEPTYTHEKSLNHMAIFHKTSLHDVSVTYQCSLFPDVILYCQKTNAIVQCNVAITLHRLLACLLRQNYG
jgi:hypothetical protein